MPGHQAADAHGTWWPTRDEGRALLTRLGVSERDLPILLEHYPNLDRPPHWWPLLVDAHNRLVASIDRPGEIELLPANAGVLGPAAPVFGVYVLLSALRQVLDWHAGRHIPETVSWATLSDLGRQVELYHRFHGRTGFDEFGWVSRHFRGLVFQLGRLQFERSHVPPEWHSFSDLMKAAGPARRMLAVHIPEDGPLSPDSCEQSLLAAPQFFTRHFPGEDYRVATCESWLLDEQLSDYLGPEANIVRFQRRFRLLPEVTVSNRAVMRFVFYRNGSEVLDDLPQNTTLQRAIVQHRQHGLDWCVRPGWLPLGVGHVERTDSER